MKHLIFVLAAVLTTSTPSRAQEGLRVRYQEPAGQMALVVSHDIVVHREPPILADRNFSFDLSFAADSATKAVTVTVDKAKADYTAHDMTQRLGTRHLTGKNVSLTVGSDGRQLEPVESSEALVIGLGPVVVPGFSIAGVLTDILPVLPDEAVAVGSTWTTERTTLNLEGWVWTTGDLVSRHRVTAIDRRHGHDVVTVKTEAEAELGPVEGGKSVSVELKRTLNWTFDATDGRLLSLLMDQQTEGMSTVTQGEISIGQHTELELTPRR